jgi:type I restriction enzyme S subunit
MIIMTCSGTIGNLVFVNSITKNAVGSPDLLRIIAKPGKMLSGYLFAFLTSKSGQALIKKGIYGAVVQHIEIPYMNTIPVPRINDEEHIHQLIEKAAELRVEADLRLRHTQDRFYRQVLSIDSKDFVWKCRNEHAFAVGSTRFNTQFHRLDGFHHVGYVGEAEQYLSKAIPLGKLINPYQPPMFKRPYTDENGIPFLSGIDLYNYYPKPHMYISRKMEHLESYIVQAGTILVQNIGQRYGLFGHPTILPKHLDRCAVTQHLMRVYPIDSRDRGFVYIWLSTELGRRLLLKHSFGTSMGVLFEYSFKEMLCPECTNDLRQSFEVDVEAIVQMQEWANELEDQAQCILASALAVGR